VQPVSFESFSSLAGSQEVFLYFWLCNVWVLALGRTFPT
jgi:hypothetical protein